MRPEIAVAESIHSSSGMRFDVVKERWTKGRKRRRVER
jgi:hypothetical protein